MTNFSLTGHMIVKNEQNWIGYAIKSVLPQLSRLLIYDTGSTDKTVNIINSFKSPKIDFTKQGVVSRSGLVSLRNQQIKVTKTPWFILVDGDEIWSKQNLKSLIETAKNAKPKTIALVNRTRNCIKDIYHYLPESQGNYQIGPWKGHLNIRLIKNSSKLKVVGQYPLESYTLNGIPIQEQVDKLEFVDTWYLHTTHLKRSNWRHQLNVIDRLKKFKVIGRGIKLKKSDLPEVLIK